MAFYVRFIGALINMCTIAVGPTIIISASTHLFVRRHGIPLAAACTLMYSLGGVPLDCANGISIKSLVVQPDSQ